MGKEIIINNKLTISNNPEEVARTSQLIEQLGSLLNIPSKLVMSIDLAIEEIISYISQHSYPQDQSGYIEIKAEVESDKLTFQISDEGVPLELLLKSDSNEKTLFLIHRTMDEVTYESIDSRNVLTLIKRLDMELKPETSLIANICKIDGITVLDIEGRLDTANASEFNKLIQPLLSEKEPYLIINCERMSYISSSGLRSFLILQKSVQKNKGTLIIEAMQPEIKQIFDMTGCTSLFQIR